MTSKTRARKSNETVAVIEETAIIDINDVAVENSEMLSGFDLGLAAEPIEIEHNTAPKWKRLPSLNQRGDDGKVVRRGKNLSGNTPYTFKFYVLKSENCDHAKLAKLPRQARLLAAALMSSDKPLIGKQVTALARDTQALVTPIDDAVLFAYYRRALETVGLSEV